MFPTRGRPRHKVKVFHFQAKPNLYHSIRRVSDMPCPIRVMLPPPFSPPFSHPWPCMTRTHLSCISSNCVLCACAFRSSTSSQFSNVT